MAVLDVPAGLDLAALRRDLLAAIPELNPTVAEATGELVPVFTMDVGARRLTVPDSLAQRVQAVLDAPAAEATLRTRADAALANLEAAWNGWDGLTPTAKDATLKLNVRATAALIRLVLRRL
jgi:hypothetical protein